MDDRWPRFHVFDGRKRPVASTELRRYQGGPLAFQDLTERTSAALSSFLCLLAMNAQPGYTAAIRLSLSTLSPAMTEVTRILSAIEQGDPHAADQLLPLVYDELRKLAAQRLAQEKPGQTLQATALVHEAYVRLVDVDQAQHWNSRGHFFAAAAEAKRRILVERARRKGRRRHGGQWQRVDLDEADLACLLPPDEVLALNDALERLAQLEPLAAELVKVHCFAGLSVEEAAGVLGMSRTAAYRHWTYARAWLFSQMRGESPVPEP